MLDRINEIHIYSPVKEKNMVLIDFKVPEQIEKFFNYTSFFVEYDNNTNINNVPNSILAIPLLSNILPVAWVSGVDVYIEEIDETFYKIIENVKAAFQNMYPNLKLKGELKTNKIIVNDRKGTDKSAQLFSGGIDSIATYIRIQESEKPALVTIWGADVSLNDITSWEKVKKYNLRVANELNTQAYFIKSNFRDVLNTVSLGEEYSRLIFGYHWWTGIQHGFGLIGLCSPLTYEKEISTFYIPASDNIECSIPWGSHPTIDNAIKWASTEVVHEGFDLNRQEKIKSIAAFIKDTKEDLQIRVCWELGHNGGNCSKCEKCCRTIVGLLTEGINPNLHGFNLPENFTKHVKNNIVQGKWSFGVHDKMTDWQEIQKHIPTNLQKIDHKYKNLLVWIKKYNFKNREPSRPFFISKIKRKILDFCLSIFNILFLIEILCY